MSERVSPDKVVGRAWQTIEADATRMAKLELENAELREQVARLQQMVGIDPLTRAMNRYLIEKKLEEEISFCHRLDIPLSVIFIDVDNFKRVNDDAERGGHQAGDAILAQLVERLKNTLRRYDLIGRYGGEEFIVILKGVNCKNAVIVAERIRMVVAEKPFEFQGQAMAITVSIGVAERKNQEMAFSLIGAADRAMLLAKRSGKNRVVADNRP